MARAKTDPNDIGLSYHDVTIGTRARPKCHPDDLSLVASRVTRIRVGSWQSNPQCPI